MQIMRLVAEGFFLFANYNAFIRSDYCVKTQTFESERKLLRLYAKCFAFIMIKCNPLNDLKTKNDAIIRNDNILSIQTGLSGISYQIDNSANHNSFYQHCMGCCV